MPSVLFHGTKSRSIITEIDPSISDMSDYGKGFYTSPVYTDSNNPPRIPHTTKDIARWNNGGAGGVIYSIAVPDDFDGYAKKHSDRFLIGSVVFDHTLAERLLKGMTDSGCKPAEVANTCLKFNKYIDQKYVTRDVVKGMQQEHNVSKTGEDRGITSTDILRSAGIIGMHNQSVESVLILCPQLLPQPTIVGFRNPQNPLSDLIGSTFDVLPHMDETLDRDVRHHLLEGALKADQGQTEDALNALQKTHALMQKNGFDIPQKLEDSIKKMELVVSAEANIDNPLHTGSIYNPATAGTSAQAPTAQTHKPTRQVLAQ